MIRGRGRRGREQIERRRSLCPAGAGGGLRTTGQSGRLSSGQSPQGLRALKSPEHSWTKGGAEKWEAGVFAFRALRIE